MGDPLPSWKESASWTAILAFVDAVIEQVGADFVLPAERFALFDNDGTQWS